MSVGERAILLLEFGEQSHVLDGDDGLVGEGLEEGDLIVTKRVGFAHADRADGTALFEHRDEDRSVETGSVCKSPTVWKLLTRSQSDRVNRPALQNRKPADSVPRQWVRIAAPHDLGIARGPLEGREVEYFVAFEPQDDTERGIAEREGAPKDCVEHWGDVGRTCTSTDTEDLAGRRLMVTDFGEL